MNILSKFAILLLILLVVLSACSLEIVRNEDGSLTVESEMTEAALQEEINAAILDPLVEEFLVDLKDGHANVKANRRRLHGDQIDSLTFRLSLSASNGHLAAEISAARLNGQPFDPARVDLWNQRLAARLSRSANRNPNASLESVTVTDQSIRFRWQIDRSG